MVFPRFVARIASFPSGASGVPVRIRSENGSNGRPCPCFSHFNAEGHGNTWQSSSLYYPIYILIYMEYDPYIYI